MMKQMTAGLGLVMLLTSGAPAPPSRNPGGGNRMDGVKELLAAQRVARARADRDARGSSERRACEARSRDRASPAGQAGTPEALKAEIAALVPDKLAWREIAWKSCLLAGLKEARERKKPLLLWIFGGEPTAGRC
jgi:hypothetical protein